VQLRQRLCGNFQYYISDLGYWLGFRYNLTGDEKDLVDGIRYCKEALALAPGNHEYRAERSMRLATLLVYRYEKDEELGDDLDEAIRLYREVVAMAPGRDQVHYKQNERISSLISLGDLLATRSKRAQNLDDINAAIRICREVAKSSKSSAHLGWTYYALNSYFSTKYKLTGSSEDLDAADENAVKIEILERSEMRRDLDKLIMEYVEAVHVLDAKPNNRAFWLRGVCRFLKQKYDEVIEQKGAVDALTEAIDQGLQGLKAMQQSHLDCVEMLDLLAGCYSARFANKKNAKDFEEAVSYAEKAIKEAADNDVLREKIAKKLENLNLHFGYK
jgi:tetratricopeptide (TPR) repeat protein